MTAITERQMWTDAVWDSDLSTTEKIVALCYAKFAGRTWPESWVAGSQLGRNTSLKSKDARIRAVWKLVVKGWLIPFRKTRHGAYVYQLVIPEGVWETHPTVSGKQTPRCPRNAA